MILENYLPIWSLFKKEILRFMKVSMQTIVGPALSSLLFLAVFVLALGNSIDKINAVPFANFIAPGLIMMTIMQNAYANSSSSIGHSKLLGTISDVLMAPLNDLEMTIGYIAGSIVRGLICGLVTAICIYTFVPISIYSFPLLIFYAVMGSTMMGCLGTMVGIWADKWDHQQGIENFVVLPMTFLSGTFYSISRLPEFWKNFAYFNPFFYNIDGFRYAFIGQSDSSLIYGGAILVILNIFLVYLCFLMIKTGYKLKS